MSFALQSSISRTRRSKALSAASACSRTSLAVSCRMLSLSVLIWIDAIRSCSARTTLSWLNCAHDSDVDCLNARKIHAGPKTRTPYCFSTNFATMCAIKFKPASLTWKTMHTETPPLSSSYSLPTVLPVFLGLHCSRLSATDPDRRRRQTTASKTILAH